MNITEQQAIRSSTAAIMLDWASNRQPPFTGEVPEDFKDAITAAHLVADEGRLELQRWVDAARRTGLSWSDIGDVLGISKQAAQQRFRPVEAAYQPSNKEGEKVVRLGATAFNEMRIMREEGRKGNELTGTGALVLIFRKTDHQWEYRRQVGGKIMSKEFEDEGWTYVSSWLPFHYFKRRAQDS